MPGIDKVTPILPHNLAQTEPRKEKGKKKKKKGKLSKVHNVVSASWRMKNAAQFQGQPGVFRPNENFHTYGNQPQVRSLGPGGLPSFNGGGSMTGSMTSHPPPGPQGHLPPIHGPPVTGPAPQEDMIEVEALPRSLRIPSRQSMFSSSGMSNPDAWAQGMTPEAQSFTSASGFPQPVTDLSTSGTFGPLFARGSAGFAPQSMGPSMYSRHSNDGPQAFSASQTSQRPRVIRRSTQLDITSVDGPGSVESTELFQ